MKKIMMLTAAGLLFQVAPVLAGHHEEGGMKQGKGAKLEEMFKKSDTNSDGAISREEYMVQVNKKAEEKFVEKDTNNDGSISKDEVKAHHEKKRAQMKENRGDMKEKMKQKRNEIREKKESALEGKLSN